MSELAFLDARAIAALIRDGRLSCREALEHFIARVQSLDVDINAVVVRDFDRARDAATRADRLPLDSPRRAAPLFGVPMTVKEAFDVAGLATTWGFAEHRDNVAEADSVVVRRLREAGAIVFGKTNVPTALADWQSFNPLYGTTSNPWDLLRTPGGSSGGSAAALAAGLCALEVGSDIGASIRNPAHYCGVYGHKTSYEIVSAQGHTLPGMLGSPDMGVMGPMARSAGDLALALDLIGGPDDLHAQAWRLRLPRAYQSRLADFRVAVLADAETAEVDATVAEPIRALGERLAAAGVKVGFDAFPAFDLAEAHRVYLLLLRAETGWTIDDAAFARDLAAAERLAPDDRGYEATMRRAHVLRHREWAWLDHRRHQMRCAWEAFFRDWDVLLCPTATTPAFEHVHEGARWERMIDVNGKPQPSTTALFWAGLPTMAYLPATAVPLARADDARYPGLPVGVQIVGPRYHDHHTIRFAELLEREFGGFVPPPALAA